MTDIAATLRTSAEHIPEQPHPETKPKLDVPANPLAGILFFGVLAAGVLYVAYSIYVDVDDTGTKVTTYLPFMLLVVALLIALGFEFVNGFHDTANAVATVIYTHSLPAHCRGGVVGLLQLPRRARSRAARWRSASSRCCRSN